MENGWKALWLKKKGCQGLPRCDSGLSWCFKQASMWNLVLIFPSIIEIPRGGVDCRDCQETWYSWTAWEFQDHWDYLNILIMINGICVKNVISSQAIQKSKWTQRSKVYCECCNYQCNPMQLIKWHLEKNKWLRFTIGVKPIPIPIPMSTTSGHRHPTTCTYPPNRWHNICNTKVNNYLHNPPIVGTL